MGSFTCNRSGRRSDYYIKRMRKRHGDYHSSLNYNLTRKLKERRDYYSSIKNL